MTIFLRWGVPAFVTVVGGTAAAIATSGAAIPPDLAKRTEAAIANSNSAWAQVSFDMRDAVIGGTATTQEMIEEAAARVAAVHGVRSVTSNVVLAEHVSPFPFVASVEGGELTLAGGVPDEAFRVQLLSEAGEGAVDTLRVMSGAPDRTNWIAATDRALEFAAELDEGEVALADLTLTVSGRAKSPASYDALNRLAAEPMPDGVELAFHEFEPAMQSPYEWRAEYDGNKLVISGATPSETLIADLAGLAPGGTAVSTSLVLASGAPADFAATTSHLIENLLKLERGSASISDTTSTLTGSPADQGVAESIRLAMTPSGTTVTLGAPQVADYWFRAERGTNGIVLDGYVPEDALLERLEAIEGVDAASLEIARGAPERFESAVDFVIAALQRMSEGRGSIEGAVVAIDGRAATLADFAALAKSLEQGAPQGLTLAEQDIRPPVATPFTFAAEKADDGNFSITGHVPGDETRRAIVAALPGTVQDSAIVADGNPSDFEAAAVKALPVLALLDSGKVSYDGASWTLSGAVDTPQKAFAAETAFASTGLRSAGWTYDVALPPAVETATLPTIDPYTWQAQKAAGAGVTFTGFLPTAPLKRYLAGHAGAGVVDGTTLGAGAPEGFISGSIGGLDALLALDEGTLSFTAGNWSLTGSVATTAERHAIEAVLRGAADTSKWHVAIQAADAAPVVTPFVWSAVKGTDGAVTLAGYVPTEDLRKRLAELAGANAVDKTLVGSGEPADFAVNVEAGLVALGALQSGELKFDGQSWGLSGQPLTTAGADAAGAALASAVDGAADWSKALLNPVQAAPVAEVAAAPVDVPKEPEAKAEVAGDSATTFEPATPAAEPEKDVASLETPATSAPVEVAADFVFDGHKVLGGPVTFEGTIPAEPMRRHLAVITGGEPEAALAIDPAMPVDFIANADAGARALALLADGDYGLAGTTWVFKGRAETDAARQAALAELSAAPGAASWQTDVTLLPPLLVCRGKVDAFAARNAILFQSGSARIAEDSMAAIDELASYLALCPEAVVSVEGHTDADGEEDANLALSVARAESVVDALILRGAGPDRLYAIGYGESLPIATNETRAGKQANRRIAFTLSDE